MQQFKARMTRLRHLIERFPQEGDIHGYAGITKQVLLSAFDTAYALAGGITDNDADNQLIIIALKRQGGAFFDKYKRMLDSDSELPEESVFNGFIDEFVALIEKVKSVYFICHSGTEHAAAELASLKTDVEEFKRFRGLYAGEYESAKNEVAALKDMHSEAVRLSEETVQSHDAAKSANEKVQAIVSDIETAGSNTQEWTGTIEKCTEDLSGMRDEFAKMQMSVSEMSQEAKKAKEESDAQVKSINENLQLSNKLLDESKLTLANANRHSMAASFEARKNELLKPMILWGCTLVAAIACIACVIIYGPEVVFTGKPFEWIGPILFRTALIAPCIWLGWYAGKQYGYTVRVREDYSFKYACAVAYEGFKKAADGEDSRLGQVLLELCMLNMSQQPLRVYADSKFGVKGLPVEEFLETVKDKLPHLDSLDLKYGKMALSAKLANEVPDENEGDEVDDEEDEN